jgi:hypothetical protein
MEGEQVMTMTTKMTLALLAGVLLLAATSAAAETRRCFTAEVPGAIVLPDGSKYASGSLRICNERTISPVSTLNRTFTAGLPVGMYLSIPREVEQVVEPGTAQFVFERNNDDELILLGYVLGAHGETVFHQMSRGDSLGTEHAEWAESDDKVVVAATVR